METISRRKFGQLMAGVACVLTGSATGVAARPEYKPIDCANPDHPDGAPRAMVLLDTVDNTSVFGCSSCWEVNRVQSVRAVTDPEYQRYVRGKLAKQGRLLTRPPFMLKTKWIRVEKTKRDDQEAY
jgi:hypothetical protein